jgi:hypothetical protein
LAGDAGLVKLHQKGRISRTFRSNTTTKSFLVHRSTSPFLERANLLLVPNLAPKYYKTKNPLAKRSVNSVRRLVPPATSSLSWTQDKAFFEALVTMRQLSITTPPHIDASFVGLLK